MSQKARSHPRRAPPSGARKPDPHRLPSPSPPPRRNPPPARRSSVNKQRKPAAESLLKRSSSEPSLGRFGSVEDGVGRSIVRRSNHGGSLSRRETGMDVYAASAASSSSSSLLGMTSPPPNYEGLEGDAKVVVNVTVEGSPGPIRAMVRLGSSVEDTVRLVMDRYGREGRAPKLQPHDALASFELHPSHFSLHGLDKSELIGHVGSRSFYLRRSSNGRSTSEASASFIPEAVPAKSSSPAILPSLFLAPTFVARRIGKIIRRTPKLWRFFICFE
ncbi:uncharacterized protein At4g22758 [Rhodamnia argentea]|uniref:Uncharacterized protein At4g22758 n=1 Tax=Rhodamnia argentea TaxID=178133 RepID=A0A8B8NQ36_9MYRT|nr:uncharacterized protein At4g22758 [Rhodamnia argentea]